MHALVVDETIRGLYARLPASARSIATGETVTPSGGVWSEKAAAECGFLEVKETPRPTDTETETHDWSVRLVDGAPVLSWEPRPMSADELTAGRRARIEANVEGMLSDLDDLFDHADKVSPAAGLRRLARTQQQVIRYLFNRLEEKP